MFFESHAHYDDSRYKDDRDKLLLELHQSNGIDYIINVGASIKSTIQSIHLSEKYDFIYATAGVHPHDVKNLNESDIEILRDCCSKKKVVAVGEIGLDFYYDNSPRDTQRYWFKKQLKLALELDKPVVIHSREASQECFDIVKDSGITTGVIHCYSGSAQMALDYADLGFYIGVGGVVTYDKAKKLVETVKALPLEKILLETDCPYLSPVPNRGKRNDSKNLIYIAKKIAEIKGVTVAEIAEITHKNAHKLFFPDNSKNMLHNC